MLQLRYVVCQGNAAILIQICLLYLFKECEWRVLQAKLGIERWFGVAMFIDDSMVKCTDTDTGHDTS